MSDTASRLSLEELGLFNILAGIEREEAVDPFLLQGLQTRGFVALATPPKLTPAGEAKLRALAARLEAEALGDPAVRAQRPAGDPHAPREVPVDR